MKESKLKLVKTRWMLAGMGIHFVVLIALFRMLGNGFDGIFDLAWANGIDGPTPLLDFLTWTIRIGFPVGCLCYGMAIKNIFIKTKAQQKTPANPHTSGPQR